MQRLLWHELHSFHDLLLRLENAHQHFFGENGHVQQLRLRAHINRVLLQGARPRCPSLGVARHNIKISMPQARRPPALTRY